MTTKTCTNGHVMTGIGFGECPECEAPWMTTPTVEEIVYQYKQKFTPLVDVTGFYDEYTKEDYRPSPRDKKIMEWLRTTLTTYGNARYEEGVKAERERVREWANKNTEWYYKGMMRGKVSCEYNECLEDLTEFLSDNK